MASITPTPQLRFVRRTMKTNKFDTIERFILQQAFQIDTGKEHQLEWRDVPLADEETGELVET